MNFSHLHLHTDYSLLNGACKIKNLADALKNLNQTAAAITDHGNLFGAVSFYNELKKNNIKPIIGCEIFLNFNLKNQGFLKEEVFHLTVLCENKIGYENLLKIVSYSNLKVLNKFAVVDFEVLKKFKEGLIFLSGCKKGALSKQILKGDFKAAKELALKFKQEFKKDNFFLELQDHGEKEEKIIKKALLKISEQTGLFVVATNNVHYIKKEDKFVKDVLKCIKNFKTLKMEDYSNNFLAEHYLKSTSQMQNLFKDCKQALKNTEEIAKRCEFYFEKFKVSIPKYENNQNKSNEKFLKEKAKEGLFLKYKKPIKEKILKRFYYELETIVKMGFVDYFLIVYDYVNYAKKKGIFVGPGRGSGAGSLISYCLNITEVDPIEFNLSFERFLNIYRTKMPDFDVDFCNERRNEVIEYVIKKYGEFRVAKIVTFGTLAYKAALRDVGRVLNMPYSFVDSIVKKISKKPAARLEECFNESFFLKQLVKNNKQVKLLFEVSKNVEGFLKNTSTHAAAVVITKNNLYNYLPLFKNEEGAIVSQYDMNSIESLNLLKMDFLGLRNLTVLSKCEQLIKKKVKDFKIELNDKKTFNMLSKGDSVGVFQLESFAMQAALKKIKPCCLKELMDVISLNRPGPSQFIDLYVKNKKTPEKIIYLNENIKKILSESYGVIIYQEQVIKIFKEIAGYSLKSLDKIRKIISKKKLELMKNEEKYFLYGRKEEDFLKNCDGAIKKGVKEKTAKEIFKRILKFSLYSFNKSHAAAYSIISYKTAFLKCHFFLEFMVAVLNSVILNKDKLKIYLKECEEKNIKILPVDVNKSDVFFKIEEKNKIRFAFLATKGVSKNFSEIILKERKKNNFISFKDFMFRIFKDNNQKELNKAVILSLVEKNAFSEIEKKEEIVKNFDVVLNDVRFKNKEIKGQINFFKDDGLNFKKEEKKVEEKLLKLNVKFFSAELKKTNKAEKFFVLKVKVLNKNLNVFSSFKLFSEFYKNLEKGTILKLIVKKTKKNNKTFLILKEIKIKRILYVKLDKNKIKDVLKVLEKNKGEDELLFFKNNEKKFFKSSLVKGVLISKELENCLKKIIGKENFYIKYFNVDNMLF